MNSKDQLDNRISSFMARKMEQFPELKDRHMTTMAPVRTRRETKRPQMMLSMQLQPQY